MKSIPSTDYLDRVYFQPNKLSGKGVQMTGRGVGRLAALLVLVGAVCGISFADLKSEKIERGRYLVEEMGQCGSCHTPRDGRGQIDRSRWLMGAQVWFRPIQPVPDWAYSAPPLAGLGSFTRDQVLQVLQKGLGPQGLPVRQPMHQYHMTPDDADAIVTYLQSLK